MKLALCKCMLLTERHPYLMSGSGLNHLTFFPLPCFVSASFTPVSALIFHPSYTFFREAVWFSVTSASPSDTNLFSSYLFWYLITSILFPSPSPLIPTPAHHVCRAGWFATGRILLWWTLSSQGSFPFEDERWKYHLDPEIPWFLRGSFLVPFSSF